MNHSDEDLQRVVDDIKGLGVEKVGSDTLLWRQGHWQDERSLWRRLRHDGSWAGG